MLTARPNAAALARVEHRLYGELAGDDPCSAGRWRGLALIEAARARAAGKLPIVVGGTGLYLQTLTDGIVELPDAPPEVRRRGQALYDRLGGPAFRSALGSRDEPSAARLAPRDRQRLVRAWEVLEATGTPLSEWQARPGTGPVLTPPWLAVRLDLPRAELYARCDARFEAMVAGGALDEVADLCALGLDPALPVMKALGVRELAAHLQGRLTLAEAMARAQGATRRYAKRQTTWFRHRMAAARVLEAQDSERILAEMVSIIREFLLTPTR